MLVGNLALLVVPSLHDGVAGAVEFGYADVGVPKQQADLLERLAFFGQLMSPNIVTWRERNLPLVCVLSASV